MEVVRFLDQDVKALTILRCLGGCTILPLYTAYILHLVRVSDVALQLFLYSQCLNLALRLHSSVLFLQS